MRRRYFEPILEAAGLPATVRMYDLRHSHATMLAQGVNVKVIAQRLGHTNPMMVLTVYGHVLPGMQAQATAQVEAALFAQGSTARA
jgi:integrase